MIDLQKVSFAYEGHEKTVDQVDVKIAEGEFIVLCGKSGCGKSTLLRILNGLIPELYEGELTGTGSILEQNLVTKEFNTFVKEIGVVFQNPKTQFFTSDVYAELAFAMENYGVPREQIMERLAELVSLFSIENLLEKSMFHLSGGQKQLVAFTSACMLKHHLFLLDEPSSNLDEVTINRLKEYLHILKQQGMTIIVSEHRLYYLSELVDRYLVMSDGAIVEQYTKEEMQKKNMTEIKNMGLRGLTETKLEGTATEIKANKESYALTCENLEFCYRKQASALFIPKLTITSECVTGIIGHNGAGKSTFSKLLSGLLKPTGGKILVDKQLMTSKKLINESFVVMQDVNLQLFFETVEKELSFKSKDIQSLEKIAKMLNLEQLLQRHPQTLSGGEKQRVAIASALLSGKKIIIFDEPTSGLDLKHMEEVSKTIHWLREKEILVLVITHDKEFLIQTCQRVLQFENGHLIADFCLEINKNN